MKVLLNDYCDYETNDNTLELFSEHMNYIDETATSVKYDYKIEDNSLTLNYIGAEDNTTEVYKKAEETKSGE
ncbi:MAG: hypothetical protein K2G83_04305 [Ruminococcus sp.]|nr:hypothetical protein [Ruminococcus sp.]